MGLEEVFIVTEGEYSDYGIVAVFLTREEAEDFLYSAHKRVANIETWKIGLPKDGSMYRTVYNVFLDLVTGDELTAHRHESIELRPENWSYVWRNRSDKPYVGARSLVSFDHALKLAAEGRQRVLRDDWDELWEAEK